MIESEKPEFYSALADVLASYAKPLPEKAILTAWWNNLAPFPMSAVRMAFSAYQGEVGEFAPVPAGIAMRCRLMDGRPDGEEAWAIALTAQDESSTVVWTHEAAQAFAICKPVLLASGAISARKPFLAAYARLVSEARAARQPTQWETSIGFDKHHQVEVVRAAVEGGLLPAPEAAPLLAGPANDPTPDYAARVQLRRVKRLMLVANGRKEQRRLAAAEKVHTDTAEFKARTRQQVADYLAGKS
jgi:hypothetical protein